MILYRNGRDTLQISPPDSKARVNMNTNRHSSGILPRYRPTFPSISARSLPLCHPSSIPDIHCPSDTIRQQVTLVGFTVLEVNVEHHRDSAAPLHCRSK